MKFFKRDEARLKKESLGNWCVRTIKTGTYLMHFCLERQRNRGEIYSLYAVAFQVKNSTKWRCNSCRCYAPDEMADVAMLAGCRKAWPKNRWAAK